MLFPSPLVRGTLASATSASSPDVVLEDGTAITAHCPNPGAMLGLNTPGLPAWISKSDDPKRKLAHTLELVEVDGGLVGINTLHPNRITAEALAADAIPEVSGYATHRREVRYGTNSRVDFLLEHPDRAPAGWRSRTATCAARARWPSSPTASPPAPLKHLRELTAMVEAGQRAVMLFVIQRTDCDAFEACHDWTPPTPRVSPKPPRPASRSWPTAARSPPSASPSPTACRGRAQTSHPDTPSPSSSMEEGRDGGVRSVVRRRPRSAPT